MIALDERRRHEEVWLLLPWLANGRLSPAEREMAEEHVRACKACEKELELQHVMCEAFTAPDRVVYAPGPSLRKLMDRIDGDRAESKGKVSPSPSKATPAPRHRPASPRSLVARLSRVSLWRPPGLAWAASFLILFGLTGVIFTAWRWSQPEFRTVTDVSAVTPNVLHIALDRTLPIGDVEEMLRTSGARIVEGPGNTGILGVTSINIVPGQTTAASASKQLHALSARLRTDPRVLWVQPLSDDAQEH